MRGVRGVVLPGWDVPLPFAVGQGVQVSADTHRPALAIGRKAPLIFMMLRKRSKSHPAPCPRARSFRAGGGKKPRRRQLCKLPKRQLLPNSQQLVAGSCAELRAFVSFDPIGGVLTDLSLDPAHQTYFTAQQQQKTLLVTERGLEGRVSSFIPHQLFCYSY